MNIYAVYNNPDGDDNSFVVVKEGFSIIALVLGVFWAIYHRMWLIAGLAIAISVIVALINIDALTFSSRVFVALVFGFLSSDVREWCLRSQGYRLDDVLIAKSKTEAEVKYLGRVVAARNC